MTRVAEVSGPRGGSDREGSGPHGQCTGPRPKDDGSVQSVVTGASQINDDEQVSPHPGGTDCTGNVTELGLTYFSP